MIFDLIFSAIGAVFLVGLIWAIYVVTAGVRQVSELIKAERDEAAKKSGLLLLLLLAVGMVSPAWAVPFKDEIYNESALTTPNDADLIPVIDVGTTTIDTAKMTIGTFVDYLESTLNLNAGGISTANADLRYLGISATASLATTASYATTAGSATSATSAGTATTASIATTANYATTAGSATSATSATSAGSASLATTANYATTAGTAGSATSATTAGTATTASYATTAGTATTASVGTTYALIDATAYATGETPVWNAVSGVFEPVLQGHSLSGLANNLYLDDSNATTPSGYHVMGAPSISATTVVDSASITSAQSPYLIESYASAALGRTSISAGEWAASIFGYVDSATGVAGISCNILLRDGVTGVETLIVSLHTGEINNTAVTELQDHAVAAQVDCTADDFLVVKMYATYAGAGTRKIHFTHNGQENYTNIAYPIALALTSFTNDAGFVTAGAVTGISTANADLRYLGITATASLATTASYATTAGSATSATTAGSASTATTANYAATAGSATTATNANFATIATTAGDASTATTANYATTAGSAATSTTANYAATAPWAGLSGVPAGFADGTDNTGSGGGSSTWDIYAYDYGVVGDGLTDDTAAMQSALDALASGYTLHLEPGKTYLITDTLTLNTSNVVIDGHGATMTGTDAIGDHRGLLEVGVRYQDGHFSKTGETAAITQYGTVVTGISDTTGLDVGDFIYFTSATAYPGYGSYYLGHSGIVLAKTLTAVTLNVSAWDTCTGATIRGIHMVRDVTVKRLVMTGAGAKSPEAGLVFYAVQNGLIDQCSITGFGSRCVWLENNFSTTVRNSYMADARYDSHGYGIVVDGHGIVVEGNRIDNCRHEFSSGTARCTTTGLIVRNNQIYCADARETNGEGGIDFHPNVSGVIDGNAISNADVGIAARARNVTIVNNRVARGSSVEGGTYGISVTQGGSDGIIIAQNHVAGPFTTGISIDPASTAISGSMVINGNFVSANSAIAISGTKRYENVTMVGNFMVSSGGSSYSYAGGVNTVINGNTLIGYRTDGPAFYVGDGTGGPGTDCYAPIITNNVIKNLGGNIALQVKADWAEVHHNIFYADTLAEAVDISTSASTSTANNVFVEYDGSTRQRIP